MRIKLLSLLAFSLAWGALFAEIEVSHNRSEVVSQKVSADSLIFRPLSIDDFDNGFIETLSAIRSVDVPEEKLADVFKERLAQGMRTYVLEEQGKIIATATMILETKFYRQGRKVAHSKMWLFTLIISAKDAGC